MSLILNYIHSSYVFFLFISDHSCCFRWID